MSNIRKILSLTQWPGSNGAREQIKKEVGSLTPSEQVEVALGAKMKRIKEMAANCLGSSPKEIKHAVDCIAQEKPKDAPHPNPENFSYMENAALKYVEVNDFKERVQKMSYDDLLQLAKTITSNPEINIILTALAEKQPKGGSPSNGGVESWRFQHDAE